MPRWSENQYLQKEESGKYETRFDQLAKPSSNVHSSHNLQASSSFRQLARLRNLTFRKMARNSPMKAELFEAIDKYAVSSPKPTDDEMKFPGLLLHFAELDHDVESNPFYMAARQGTTLFRTSLGAYPVSNVKLGVVDGMVGDLLDKLYSITPLDFAVAGMQDRLEDETIENDLDDFKVVMTTEFLDPHLDLIYDIDGRAWEFDGELHCVGSGYNYWREIRTSMVLRNGRVNKAHIILFAALRVAAFMDAISPLTQFGFKSNYAVREYLLCVLNAAVPLIRIFKLILSLIPTGGHSAACDSVTSDLNVLVECRSDTHRITVSTNYSFIHHLIIKAVLEGATRIDVSQERDDLDADFSSYGNSMKLIESFLLFMNELGSQSSTDAEIDTGLKTAKALIALSLNSKFGTVRESLTSRNNGLICGVNTMLRARDRNLVQLSKSLAELRGIDTEGDECDNGLKNVLQFSQSGDSGDSDGIKRPESGLYQLQPPLIFSMTLQRRGTVIGKLSVENGQLKFKKEANAVLGLLPIFQKYEDCLEEGNTVDLGVSVKFEASEDTTTVANACLSNCFGVNAAIFVLEHIMFGDITLRQDCAPGYLQHTKMSAEGAKITSYLHPEVTAALAVYTAREGLGVSFDKKRWFDVEDIHEVLNSPHTANVYWLTLSRNERSCNERIISLGKSFLA